MNRKELTDRVAQDRLTRRQRDAEILETVQHHFGATAVMAAEAQRGVFTLLGTAVHYSAEVNGPDSEKHRTVVELANDLVISACATMCTLAAMIPMDAANAPTGTPEHDALNKRATMLANIMHPIVRNEIDRYSQALKWAAQLDTDEDQS